MKLLTVHDTKKNIEAAQVTLEKRSASLDDSIVEKRKELQSLDEELLRVLENSRLTRLQEDTEWQKRNDELRKETEELEERRKEALVPLEKDRQEIETEREALSKREQKVLKREEEVALTQELVEGRLDEASDRLASVRDMERKLSFREEGIKAEEALTSQKTREFNDLLTRTLASFKERESSFAKQKAELDGRDIALAEREKRVNFAEKDLVSRERALADKYRTLERATKETQNKHASTP